MRRDIVIFDFNGTLVDSVPGLIADAVAVLRDEFGVPEERSRQTVRESIGLPPEEMFARLGELTGGDAAAGRRAMSLIAQRFQDRPAPLFPEVPAALAELRRLGCTLVLSATMEEEVLDRRLRQAAIREHFALVLGSQPTRAVLKGAAHFQAAAEGLGITLAELKRRAVSVGDSPHDMALARGAGIPAVGRLGSEGAEALRAAGADYFIQGLEELPALLAELE